MSLNLEPESDQDIPESKPKENASKSYFKYLKLTLLTLATSLFSWQQSALGPWQTGFDWIIALGLGFLVWRSPLLALFISITLTAITLAFSSTLFSLWLFIIGIVIVVALPADKDKGRIWVPIYLGAPFFIQHGYLMLPFLLVVAIGNQVLLRTFFLGLYAIFITAIPGEKLLGLKAAASYAQPRPVQELWPWLKSNLDILLNGKPASITDWYNINKLQSLYLLIIFLACVFIGNKIKKTNLFTPMLREIIGISVSGVAGTAGLIYVLPGMMSAQRVDLGLSSFLSILLALIFGFIMKEGRFRILPSEVSPPETNSNGPNPISLQPDPISQQPNQISQQPIIISQQPFQPNPVHPNPRFNQGPAPAPGLAKLPGEWEVKSNSLCMGCMLEKGPGKICPHCGFNETAYGAVLSNNLPLRTILNQQYLIGKVLGSGGFGVTYLGWDLVLNTKIAVKEYFPRELVTRLQGGKNVTLFTQAEKGRYDQGIKAFLEEARKLAQFEEYAGIVSVRTYFEEHSTAYMLMPYLEGITLKEYLGLNGGRLPWTEALSIVNPVLEALQAVHKIGLLHRDISPDNIYLTSNCNVKLLDFGAARYAIGDTSRSLSVILKPGYAPVEQYQSKGQQGPWTDIYALAATLYHMISGYIPPEAFDRLDEDCLRPIASFGVEIPPALEQIIQKALKVKAAERYQTVSELREALNSNFKAEPFILRDVNLVQGLGAIEAAAAASEPAGTVILEQDNRLCLCCGSVNSPDAIYCYSCGSQL